MGHSPQLFDISTKSTLHATIHSQREIWIDVHWGMNTVSIIHSIGRFLLFRDHNNTVKHRGMTQDYRLLSALWRFLYPLLEVPL